MCSSAATKSVSHLSYASSKPFPNILLLHQLSQDPTSTNPQSGAATFLINVNVNINFVLGPHSIAFFVTSHSSLFETKSPPLRSNIDLPPVGGCYFEDFTDMCCSKVTYLSLLILSFCQPNVIQNIQVKGDFLNLDTRIPAPNLYLQYLWHLPQITCLPTHAIYFIPTWPNPRKFSSLRGESPAKLLIFWVLIRPLS